jgi:ABC-type lipoprotein export system ATPase subunit
VTGVDAPARDVLRVRGVSRSVGEAAAARLVLAGLDLSVAAGEIVALVGRSGSGKTTLLTLVAGFDEPEAGTVDRPGGPSCRWRELAVLPQSLGLLGELTVAENVLLPLRLDREIGGEDAPALLERLGIAHLSDRYPSEVSLGEQQRTALARAAVVRPSLLLADEPISHQNDAWAREMMAVVVDLAAAGTACLLATHNEVATEVAHRVLELRDGRLVDAAARSAP